MNTTASHQQSVRPLVVVNPASNGARLKKKLFGKFHWLKPLLLLCCLVSAASADTFGLFTYTNDGTSITISGYPTTAVGVVEIPTNIVGEPVTSIGSFAFNACAGLTSITIPSSVTSIGTWAFQNCTSLGSITIPSSVTSIGASAFNWCSGLTSITIPPSVTSIGQQAFYGCSGLTSIAIPNSITSIPDYAFSACTGLTSITIPNSVTSIGTSAFQSCTGLTSITIPTSVTSIGTNAFYNCTGLTSVTIPNSIGSDAFTGCSNLKSVTVPSSVTSIHPLAFNGCTKLLSLVVDPVNPNYSSLNGVLFDKLNTSLLLYPNGKSGEYIIPSSVTSIGTSAFQSCTSLTSVTIPNSVASIGNFAFSGCTSLGRVTISSSVTSIGSFAFSGCTVLSSCYIMGNAPGLGTSVFNSTQATVYYLNGTLGWKATFGGLVTVALVLPSIIVPPISLSVGTGESAAFNVIAQTTFPLTLSYQWQRNGIAIPSATATSLVLNNIQAANAGTYTVVVANDVGSVASSSTLTLAQGGLYTQVQYDAALQQGMTAGLQTGMSAGRSQVLDYPNTYGLYSLKQVQALNVGVPLLAKDPVSGKFKLTIGVKKSIDLITYGAFPIPTGAASLNANGEMEFQFSSPDKAAFFRLDSH